MSNFRYSLAKNNQAKKVDCPNCGHKRRFVLFIDNETGNIMPNEYGKCDRMESCGYSKYPSGNIQTTKTFIEEIKEPSYLSYGFFLSHFEKQFEDSFFKFLCTKFDKKTVINSYYKYKIGAKEYNNTICPVFFQIDAKLRIRTGKFICYGEDGHRIKDCGNNINWVHKKFKNYNLNQCFFGEHLIANNDKEIVIVEAKKYS